MLMYTTIQVCLGSVRLFSIEINTSIQQGRIQLIKSDIYKVAEDLYLKLMLSFWTSNSPKSLKFKE